MTVKSLLPVSFLISVMVSCNNSGDSGAAAETQPSPPAQADTQQQKNNAAAALPPGKFRLNPPHGQPGHSCDVPEGAPISNQPAALNTIPQQVLQAPAPQPINPAAPATTAATPVSPQAVPAGMNPPHGQPGHRCDIAVGAPLNSKPAAPPKQIKEKILTPAVAATAPGMNPPHGQPGHRCDIAVGAPLNSKPAAAPAQITGTPPPVTAEKKDSSIPLE